VRVVREPQFAMLLVLLLASTSLSLTAASSRSSNL